MGQDETLAAGRPGRVSVVIPAHDEASVIGANLHTLLAGVDPGRLDVVVVCNGCTDDTADIARRFTGVRVLEIPQPSKAHAIRVGHEHAAEFPRVLIDADVAMSGPDVLALAARLDHGVLAAGPTRVLPLERSSWPVRSYYRVWEQLPQVRRGLFGRGAIALTVEGQRRVDALPQVMSDDLAISEAFSDDERSVVDEARVVVQPPRTTRDLLNRRVRVVTGNAQAAELGIRHRASVTTPAVLLRMALRDPRIAVHIPIFLGIGLLARVRSRRAVRTGDFTTWLRDESSRSQPAGHTRTKAEDTCRRARAVDPPVAPPGGGASRPLPCSPWRSPG